jgi:hypothetical protein
MGTAGTAADDEQVREDGADHRHRERERAKSRERRHEQQYRQRSLQGLP